MARLYAALAAAMAACIPANAEANTQRKPRPPPPSMPGSNPLVALASALVGAMLYLLQLFQSAVAFVTITVPTKIVSLVHYSFTISLGFPHFVALFVVVVGTIFFVVRYRYLTKYTKLKEPALPPPSPPTLSNSLPLIGDALLRDHNKRSANPLHSYLDDFLSAIRIFGYLEKPIFHELSRHLQTRRLAAGDTMELGGNDFWCVVEGRVQVFAPSKDEDAPPASPDPFQTSDSFNGYSLINEVATGGTLTSLFSILSLFTEDIKLPWEDNEEPQPESRMSRANSDVSQLDGKTMGGLGINHLGLSPPQPLSPVTATDESVEKQTQPSASVPSNPSGGTEQFPSEPNSRSPSPSSGRRVPEPRSTLKPDFHLDADPGQHTPGSNRSRRGGTGTPFDRVSVEGSIARASVDSTLAVIPAQAFRKLTAKYPKATGSIVQVVLERFSRVTFLTAHKFLGLTREILRSEAALNTLVSNPLPRAFYTGGGMQALRERFQPELRRRRKGFPSADASPTEDDSQSSKDYFNYEPPSPTVKAPSIPNSSKLSTPHAKATPLKVDAFTKIISDSEDTGGELSASPVNIHHPSAMIRRQSARHKEVAAGDLATSRPGPEGGAAYYRPMRTPGLPRMDTWRPHTESRPEDSDEDDQSEFELRDALVACIARSIGLLQANEPHSDSRGTRTAASAFSVSTPDSPLFLPNGRPSQNGGGKPPFGNVLDMMNATRPDDNISGLLRQSLLNARMNAEDDQSSISVSMHDSSVIGGAPDVNAKILRDLGGHLDIMFFKKGSTIVKAGEHTTGLYYVIDGFLDVSIPVSSHTDDNWNADASSHNRPFGAAMGHESPDDPKTPGPRLSPTEDEQLYTVKSGGLAGYLASLTETESYVNITAKTDTFVGFLPQAALVRLTERRPIVLLTLAKRLLSLLSPLVLHIDAGLDWIQLDAGQILYEKGEKSKDFFIAINGRLRSVVKKRGDSESVEVLREYGQNDSIGELDVMTAAPRSDTVQAIRETELVRIPAALFDALSTRHPATTVQFMRLIAGKVRKAVGEMHASTHHASNTAIELRNSSQLKTVCVLGANRSVPVASFARKLKQSIEEIGGTTSYLDQASVMRHLGRHAFTRMGALKIAGWLADQEQHYRIVLYVADTPPASQWTQTCIRQADLVLVVGMGDDPQLGEYEKLLMQMKCYARRELVLLHDERAVVTGSTRMWLKNRPWIQAHHHVELPGLVAPAKAFKHHDPAAVVAFKHLRERVETKIKQYRGLRPLDRQRRPPHANDFARVARRLCNKQVGLVLGGGGARGISHIGMLQALEEAGIPVDAISGCSIGAFVGGMYSRQNDLIETTGRVKQFAGRMGSVIRLLSDVTYPFVAYTTGHEFNRGIYKAFLSTHIEDFWIPFYCNSTNITHSRMEIHRSGYAWRYVRASMTLAGLLPPLSDNGNLLVDGGYMDNTPIGPLRASGISDIIVVDVGSLDDTSSRNYGDSVSGWWLFVNRFNPFFKSPVPSMTEISSRLTYVSSVKTLEDVKADPNCLYMAMPVQQFETLGGFKQFSQVRQIGLDAARAQIKEWAAEGRLPHGLVEAKRAGAAVKRGTRLRRSSI